jgi:hypothetical protein
MPETRGKPVPISAFVDANHAGNIVTWRQIPKWNSYLCTECSNHLAGSLSNRILWKQGTIFGSELIVSQICKDLIVALHYKLWMFGEPIAGLVNVFCDNQGVVKNLSILEWVCIDEEASTIRLTTICVGKEDGQTNLAHLLTKP